MLAAVLPSTRRMMSADREPSKSPPQTRHHTPRWRLVQTAIEREIAANVLAPGDRLPTEEELAERFSVHRNTIRRAIERLREKHLVRVEQGRGTFVREPAITYKIGRGTRLTTAARDHERRLSRRVLSSETIQPDRVVAAALSVRPDARVQRVTMLRLIEDRPIALSSHHYPLPRLAGIDDLIRETGSISQALRTLGVTELQRKSLHVTAVLSAAREAKLLGIGRGQPLIELVQLNLDQSGIPVQFGEGRFIPGWLDLVFEF
jgi:GntR family phosphonate transport system transcriptional regulator